MACGAEENDVDRWSDNDTCWEFSGGEMSVSAFLRSELLESPSQQLNTHAKIRLRASWNAWTRAGAGVVVIQLGSEVIFISITRRGSAKS